MEDFCVPSYPSIGTDGKLDFKGGGLRGTFTAIAPSGGITPAEAETVEEAERNRGCIDFSKEREEWRDFERINAERVAEMRKKYAWLS